MQILELDGFTAAANMRLYRYRHGACAGFNDFRGVSFLAKGTSKRIKPVAYEANFSFVRLLQKADRVLLLCHSIPNIFADLRQPFRSSIVSILGRA